MYYLQNTLHSDFLHMTQLMFKRPIAWGHQPTDLRPLLLEATEWLEIQYDPMADKNNSLFLDSCSDNALFVHIPFHSCDISCCKTPDIYERTCEGESQGCNFYVCPMISPGRPCTSQGWLWHTLDQKYIWDLLRPSKTCQNGVMCMYLNLYQINSFLNFEFLKFSSSWVIWSVPPLVHHP